jgi:F-type H+-transporting ATPase subunit epsilon
MADFTCIVVTPEATVLEEKTSFVALPLHDGEKGIGPNHAPFIARLGCGELRLKTESGEAKNLYVDGGFVQVADNAVSVLTDRAIPTSGLNEEAARDLLETAKHTKAALDEQIDAREKAVQQARAQIRVAQRAKN